MLTYTFSRREKALILGLVVVLLAVAWYVLVYQRTNDEIARINSEISQVETDTTIANARVVELRKMQDSIERYQAEGIEAVKIPAYDNLRPLMSELNAIMATANSYTLTFDDLDRETVPGYVLRGARIDYGSPTYESAESIVNAVANGSFPCSIDSVSIVDNTATRAAGSRARTTSVRTSAIGASLHVVFFEEDANYQPPKDEAKENAS